MGQQQLLLLVLGIVIVGLAVALGIQAFSTGGKQANADALINDAIRIASDAQAYTLKPSVFGGGNGSFANVKMTQLGYEAVDGLYENLNGRFAFTNITAEAIEITACSLIMYSEFYNEVTVTVTGTGGDAVATVVGNADTDCSPTSAEP